MNNKPVAWMNPNESSIDYKFSDECAGDWNIPLYTHPVKELTDKEILGVWKENSSSGELYYDLLEFARAILKKAQK